MVELKHPLHLRRMPACSVLVSRGEIAMLHRSLSCFGSTDSVACRKCLPLKSPRRSIDAKSVNYSLRAQDVRLARLDISKRERSGSEAVHGSAAVKNKSKPSSEQKMHRLRVVNKHQRRVARLERYLSLGR
jgi:hypothetical protein